MTQKAKDKEKKQTLCFFFLERLGCTTQMPDGQRHTSAAPLCCVCGVGWGGGVSAAGMEAAKAHHTSSSATAQHFQP